MMKYEIVRLTEDCVTPLRDRKTGGWGFQYRDSPESPWQDSQELPRVKALELRRRHLIRHARRLLGKSENYQDIHKHWSSNV